MNSANKENHAIAPTQAAGLPVPIPHSALRIPHFLKRPVFPAVSALSALSAFFEGGGGGMAGMNLSCTVTAIWFYRLDAKRDKQALSAMRQKGA
ncbi:MAG: hypothetical protein JWQ04_2123 [Pedosphaera sp.]|nr:hypothetical protein [Pedosphaera sp.]